jgi:phosphopantothenoylcysteine decarboxylase/phosphopantothenate--cysteine ligase
MRPFDGRRVLLVVSGGIAAYKSAILLRRLRGAGATVDVLLTEAAQSMVGRATFEALSGRPVHTDLWERPLAHVELGRDADVAVVAPATAHLLARMALGLADDMASATLLAAACPLVVCPAMNSRMWEHPATRENLRLLVERGCRVVGPDHGELAEGEAGPGRLAEPEVIVAEIGRALDRGSALAGRKVVVTAGPTRSALDPVRYVGNRSSGRMGTALAASAWRRGADTVLVHGPCSVPFPHGPRRVAVESSREMLDALREELRGADVLLMAAAVADFEATDPVERKIRRDETGEELVVRLRTGPDLLAETKELRAERGVLTLGFALETEDGRERARRKLEAKGMDLVALNEAGRPDRGFDASTNAVTVLDRDGGVEEIPLLPKEDVAERLLDRLESRLGD